jgi:hypothetical protein
VFAAYVVMITDGQDTQKRSRHGHPGLLLYDLLPGEKAIIEWLTEHLPAGRA